MYPSERYKYLIDSIHKDSREQVRDYVDESYHQDITLKELECHTWKEVIDALARYVHSHVYKAKHAHLINDYRMYLDALHEPPTKKTTIRRQGEWTYIKHGVEEIRVKKSESGLEIQRVLPGPPVSQDDFDAAVKKAEELE